ncbi:MAG: hypothetical protein ACK53Y_23820, partial [bacterium]
HHRDHPHHHHQALWTPGPPGSRCDARLPLRLARRLSCSRLRLRSRSSYDRFSVSICRGGGLGAVLIFVIDYTTLSLKTWLTPLRHFTWDVLGFWGGWVSGLGRVPPSQRD